MRLDNCSRKLSFFLLLAGLASTLLAGNAAAESLQQAWETALAVNHTLRASRENSAAAANLFEAAKSGRLPNVVLEAGYFVLDNTPELKAQLAGQSMQIPLAQQNGATYKTMATLPLYTGGRITSGINAAAVALDAAKFGEIGDRQSLKLQVADSFIGVLRAGHILKVAESHVKSLEAHFRDAENLYEQGMVARSDLLSARVALADARQKSLQAANRLELASAGYNRLLGRPLDQLVSLDEFIPSEEEEKLSALTDKAISQRSELAALTCQVSALRHQADAVRGENWPQVGLSGGYSYQQNRYQEHEGQWLVTLGVRWNIFDGSAVSQRANAIEHQAGTLAEQRQELSSIVKLQVRQAWLDVQETRKRIDVTQSAIAMAEENLRVVVDRYANGLSTHTEVLDAEALRVNSETSDVNAHFDNVIAQLWLKRTTGEL
ncbi:MAG: TolC family protein [Desulfuromonadaceae bacterium]